MRDVNLETITDTLTWYKILPLNEFNLIRAKRKTSQETKKSSRKFLEPSHKPKSIFLQTSRWSLGKHVKIHHGITELQHLIDLETNGIAERAVRREKRGNISMCYCHSPDWMNRWGADSVECCCYLRNVQDLLSDGKTPYE